MALRTILCAVAIAATFAPPAQAARTEVAASAAIVEPNWSLYRGSAEVLGYGSRSVRQVYEGELAATRAFGRWVSAGPVIRGYFGKIGAPYDGVSPIETYAGYVGLRAESDLFTYPRFFVWADPSIGVGSIGATGARRTIGTWGVRFGLGIGCPPGAAGFRFRVGWSYAPTFGKVTDLGDFDFGGFVFAFEGVLRVAE